MNNLNEVWKRHRMQFPPSMNLDLIEVMRQAFAIGAMSAAAEVLEKLRGEDNPKQTLVKWAARTIVEGEQITEESRFSAKKRTSG